MTLITFTVPGKAISQGSKRHVGGGRMIESSKRLKPWRSDVRDAAQLEMLRQGGKVEGVVYTLRDPIPGPVRLSVNFQYRRPASHLNTRGELNAGGRRVPYPTRPDLDKLCRGLCDALTGVVWNDDRQVVDIRASRTWGPRDEAQVQVLALGDGLAPAQDAVNRSNDATAGWSGIGDRAADGTAVA